VASGDIFQCFPDWVYRDVLHSLRSLFASWVVFLDAVLEGHWLWRLGSGRGWSWEPGSRKMRMWDTSIVSTPSST
jgi:hypothetical protein